MNEIEPKASSTAVATEEPHYIVARLLEQEQGGTMQQFFAGLRTPFSAVKFLAKRSELWPKVAVPALINVAVFVLTAGFLLWNADWFTLAEPTQGSWTYWVLIVLWWIYKIILYPLLIIIAYFLTLMLAGIVASPFNEALSEHVERIFVGDAVPAEEGWGALIAGGIRGIAFEAFTTIPRVFLVVLLGLIPGLGPVLAALVGAYFVALAYTDYAFERRKYTLKRKFDTVWKHRRLALGFGVGANVLLIVPLLNFLAMPIAVVAGTAVAITLDEFEKRGLHSE